MQMWRRSVSEGIYALNLLVYFARRQKFVENREIGCYNSEVFPYYS